MIKTMKCEICKISFEYSFINSRKRHFCSQYCNQVATRIRTSFYDAASYEDKILRLKFYFEKKVIKKDNCWDWKGALLSGRGVVFFERKAMQAHRASWLLHRGQIPKNMYVCHKCDNPICSNPDHLFLGTPKENVIDAVLKKRLKQQKLSIVEVSEIKALLNTSIQQKDIAKMFKVSTMTISDIKLHKTWSHI